MTEEEKKPEEKETPAKQAQEDAEEPEIVVEEEETHPLAPGGIRFEQVVAQKKQAEDRAAQLAAEKARLEAELAAKQTPPKQETKEREYTEDELDALEEQARIRGDRAAVRNITNYRIQRQAKILLDQEKRQTAQVTVGKTVGSTLFADFQDLNDPSSSLYKAAATEYAEVAKEYALMGRDVASDPYATEVAVSRAVRKNPDLAKKAPKREVASEGAVVSDDRPAPKQTTTVKLTKRELDFCRRSGQDPKEYAKWRREKRAE